MGAVDGDLLGTEKGDEGSEERQGRVEEQVVDAPPDRDQHLGDDETDDDATAGCHEELHAHPREGDAAGQRHQRCAQRNQRGRVVDEAFALEDVDDAARHAYSAGDGRGGDGVGWGNHRPQRERRCEGYPRHHPVAHEPDHET